MYIYVVERLGMRTNSLDRLTIIYLSQFLLEDTGALKRQQVIILFCVFWAAFVLFFFYFFYFVHPRKSVEVIHNKVYRFS